MRLAVSVVTWRQAESLLALERLLLGEAGADLPQHRHGALGPFGAALPLVGEGEVLDVILGDLGLNAHLLLSGRPTAGPSRGRSVPR